MICDRCLYYSLDFWNTLHVPVKKVDLKYVGIEMLEGIKDLQIYTGAIEYDACNCTGSQAIKVTRLY